MAGPLILMVDEGLGDGKAFFQETKPQNYSPLKPLPITSLELVIIMKVVGKFSFRYRLNCAA